MLRRILIAGIFSQLFMLPVHAQGVRELGQEELRLNVEAGRSLGLSKILARIENRVDGELLDARAFEAGGVFYRVLVLLPSGKLVSIVVDAATGQPMGVKSQVAARVREAARQISTSRRSNLPTNGNGDHTSGNSNNGGGSNGGGNGNSGGGSNGGGNGNSGGGNGNSGGNNGGNGNSGGNGGGNGKN